MHFAAAVVLSKRYSYRRYFIWLTDYIFRAGYRFTMHTHMYMYNANLQNTLILIAASICRLFHKSDKRKQNKTIKRMTDEEWIHKKKKEKQLKPGY